MDMAVNPDPKPGRWILPLVILGMIAFTYFFVSELPEASPDSTLAGQLTTTTFDETTATSEPESNELDPATQAYLDEIEAINDQLQVLGVEMVTVNDGFDADPRTIEYGDTESRLEAVETQTQELSAALAKVVVPFNLQVNQDVLTTAMQFATLAAGDALNGLRSADTGELRRDAVAAYTRAVADFQTEVTNANNSAQANAST